MRVLVINLASAAERLALQTAQLSRLGLEWERVDGVTPDTLAPPATDPVWHRWQRPLRPTEMALLASHVRAWRRVVELRSPCLVLEDDALLASPTPAFLAQVEGLADADHISLETRGRKKAVARTADPRAPLRRLWQDRTGSAAYVVWPAGAAQLIVHAAREGGPSDAIISATYGLRSFQADPALAIQIDQCDAYGVPQPIAAGSTVDAVKKPAAMEAGYALGERAGFRARRFAAQVRIGLRQYGRPFAVARRHVLPALEWPALGEIRVMPPALPQAIPAYVINLARRPDRLARLGGQLDALGIRWERIEALDARAASQAELDAAMSAGGPLGRLGDGDRACTVSHMRAWSRLLQSDAPFALVLEDDVYLSRDARAAVAVADWIPKDVELVKLEKFGDGVSNVLLGPRIGMLPGGQRALHRMHSRHVGGAAYIISRRAAREGMKTAGSLRVPVDHLLFNPSVSKLSRRLAPTVVCPAMATQRHYGYDSDVAALGKAVRPKGWRRRARSLKRGLFEVWLLPRQVLLAASGRARLQPLHWQEEP